MQSPRVTRPHFPAGYLEAPTTLLQWEQVWPRLAEAQNYWLCSVRPDGRPHVIPKWAVWVDDKIYFDGSPQTRHARNIALNPQVALHLESGSEVVIVEGTCRELPNPDRQLTLKIAAAYCEKYAAAGYAPQPDQWDAGGLFEITPQAVLAWTQFNADPTKFSFDPGPG
ncbi:MAG TPA: pyridoxamine 5'-phosphate oxidase family protein [Anaerolineaceae bacterium]|nr:pyridoxamine 5'-phosphate oxidase family protein [Anaerolineaceae bacterium]HQF63186.1 pyridoxamine 5'-phosphate oxidase family protein [Anaerolineaceae bacterium]HQH86172.1 pyridoxamine 5'-phosphate oxidase family protein [Anaerolineaceae bacterium]